MSDISSTSSNASAVAAANTVRITGLASGLDVDGTVKKLMAVENMKLDKQNQKLQTMQWRQDSYRETMSDLSAFSSTYFDVLKSDSYMLSTNNYAGFDVASSDSTTASASTILGAAAGNYSLSVDQIAAGASIQGGNINSQVVINTGAINSNWSSKTLNFSVDGVDTFIGLDSGITSIEDLVNNINSKITGNPDLKGKLSASYMVSNGITSLKLNLLGTNVITSDISDVGSSATENKILNATSSMKLSDLDSTLGSSPSLSLVYNGVTTTVNVDGTKTVGDLITAISTATSGNVTAKFDDLTGKFTLQTTNTGSGSTLSIGASPLSTALGITAGAVQGKDAIVTIIPPGGIATTVTESKNNFTINGVVYNIIKPTASTAINITVASNPQKVFDKISALIDKYNEAITKINTKINEKKDYSYQPLTTTQKTSMSADQITAWETKAKAGIIGNDSNLESMLSNMRTAFYTPVEGAGISLSDIGLATSSDVTQGGKILIDKTKLMDAIQNQGDKVAKLFMQQSTSDSSYSPDLTNAQRATRTSEEGIFQRINDLLQDNIGTIRNSAGLKGTLLNLAGLKGDFTEYNNIITSQMTIQNKAITTLTQMLADKQTKYYSQFTALEVAMTKLNNQQSLISQYLGTSASTG